MHDILTGSQADGTRLRRRRRHDLRQLDERQAGAAMVGHHDRMGLRDDDAVEVLELVAPVARPERRLQPGRAAGTGGAGLFYCFAAN